MSLFPAEAPPTERRLLAALLIAFLAIGIVYNVVTPLFEASDEYWLADSGDEFQSLSRDSVSSSRGQRHVSAQRWHSFNPSVGILSLQATGSTATPARATRVSIPQSGFCLFKRGPPQERQSGG